MIDYITKPEFKILEYLNQMINITENDKLTEHSIWCLNNLMDEAFPELMGEVLKTDLMPRIDELIQREKLPMNIARVVSWSLCKLSNAPRTDLGIVQGLMECISTLLFINDDEAHLDLLLAFVNLTSKDEETEELTMGKYDIINTFSILPKVVSIFAGPNKKCSAQALRVIGNVSSLNHKGCEQELLKASIFIKGKFSSISY